MTSNPTCIYYNQEEQESPSLQFTYRGCHDCIYPQHLPRLIHFPDQLANKLPIFRQLHPVESHL